MDMDISRIILNTRHSRTRSTRTRCVSIPSKEITTTSVEEYKKRRKAFMKTKAKEVKAHERAVKRRSKGYY